LSSPRIVAVTGGSGQLGTHVLRRLLADPAIDQVISIDRRPPIIGSPKLKAVTGDVCDGAFARHLQGVDALVHCAFIISGGERSPVFRAVNVEGSKNVFRAAASAGVKTVTFVSSVSAYGCVPGHPVPIVESTPRVRQEEFAYACCKYDVEAYLDEVELQYPDIAVNRIRANILVGRRMPHLLGLVMRIGWIPDFGGHPFPIVWDEDVADLLVLAVKQGARGAYNAGADELLPSAELAARTGATAVQTSRIMQLIHTGLYELSSRLNLNWFSDPSWATRALATLIMSSERAKRELGWTPRHPTAVSVVERFREVSPWRLDVWLLLVLWMLSRATRSAASPLAGRSGRMFLCLNGPVAGDFSLLVENGTLRVRAGAPSLPTSTVTMTATLFRDLLAGRASLDDAFASGKIDWFGPESDRELFRKIVGLPAGRHGGAWRLAARLR
jgi:UDP-glucose 4-epimerase